MSISPIKMQKTSKLKGYPAFYELLSKQDQMNYDMLRNSLSSPNCKNRRNKSIETFQSIIDTIHQFVVRNDGDDIKRALVCGVFWFKNSIAINIRQLKFIMSKCKSSINNSFKLLGYGTVPQGINVLREPFSTIHKCVELRQWTVRQKISQKPEQLTDIISGL